MPFELLSSGRKENQKDLVGYFADFGRQVKKLFPKNREKQKELDLAKIKNFKLPNLDSHEFFFGVVYANDLAKSEFDRENPQFPVGSIIVREKNAAETSEIPVSVIAMVKREKGFSKDSGDWEFFTFNGADLKMQNRETKGDCAACHIRAEKTDWVFRDYLK